MTNFLKVRFCLEEIAALGRFKDKEVIKIADVGCGPGTASLACADFFRNAAMKIDITAIDQNTSALHDAKHIFSQFANENVRLKTFFSHLHPQNISRSLKDKFDIIITANLLSEMGDIGRQKGIVDALIANHLNENGIIIIIEPALRWTTRNLMKLRNELLCSHAVMPSCCQRQNDKTARRQDSITILSPCLHNNPCPMLSHNNRDWCHMYLDWKRPTVIKEVDKLIGNWKDYLKFSYMIFSKASFAATPSHQIWRSVSAPMRSKGKIELLLCNRSGLLRVTRLDKNKAPKNQGLDTVSRGDIVNFNGGQFIGKDTEFRVIKQAP